MKLLAALCCATLLLGCRKSAEKSPTTDLIGQVASEVKDKPRIQMLIKIGTEQPTPEDQALLRSLEETIEREGIGRLTSSGNQPGYIFVIVEAENSADAISRLRKVALDAGLVSRASFRVIATGA